MPRQGVTQHLGVLETANLVVSRWRGREKLHFLSPVPLQEICKRWIAKLRPLHGETALLPVKTNSSRVKHEPSSPSPTSLNANPLNSIEAVSGGWPKVISNLKSLLETGSAVPRDPCPTGDQC